MGAKVCRQMDDPRVSGIAIADSIVLYDPQPWGAGVCGLLWVEPVGHPDRVVSQPSAAGIRSCSNRASRALDSHVATSHGCHRSRQD